jgi:tRNA A22 N-methylase
MHVSQAATHVLTPVGSLLWQSASKAHIAYYHALLLHYQRIAQKGGQEAMNVVEDYQALAHQIPALKEI